MNAFTKAAITTACKLIEYAIGWDPAPADKDIEARLKAAADSMKVKAHQVSDAEEAVLGHQN